MRAAILTPDLTAEPWHVGEVPDPEPPPGWVLVRVRFAGVNWNDALWVRDRHELPQPWVIGSDAAGTVVGLGEGVTGVAVGDDVLVFPTLWWGDDDHQPAPGFQLLGFPTPGTYGELLTVPAENVFTRPTRLSAEQAAALPLAGMTAWRALTTRGQVKPDETVIVTAASSGVGTFAVQMARALGARVIAVTSTAARAKAATELGADAVVLRTSDTYGEDLKTAAGPEGADLVIDSTGASWPLLQAAMGPGARMVSLGRNGSGVGELDVWSVFWKHQSFLGSSLASPRDFQALVDHVARASWVPVVDEVLPLEEVGRAHERLVDPARVGKVLLDLG